MSNSSNIVYLGSGLSLIHAGVKMMDNFFNIVFRFIEYDDCVLLGNEGFI